MNGPCKQVDQDHRFPDDTADLMNQITERLERLQAALEEQARTFDELLCETPANVKGISACLSG